jgi:hypothetical protein
MDETARLISSWEYGGIILIWLLLAFSCVKSSTRPELPLFLRYTERYLIARNDLPMLPLLVLGSSSVKKSIRRSSVTFTSSISALSSAYLKKCLITVDISVLDSPFNEW